MAISEKEVIYIANLARMQLKNEELTVFKKQLENILDFINKLKKLDVSSIEPTSHVLALRNVFRSDQRKKSLKIEAVLKNAPERQGNFFVVPKVIE